ncbi:RHOMBOID-like protein 1 isoform X1 [Ananas comosus]|uniref:RHOMBOID-like protein n=1 Tax=Ananas comosus TaxID=4615 RepID=A0A6P5G9T6_ANACO|nr:RHOMBOID-like protein 1 isoform X1 [Ananas comosus]
MGKTATGRAEEDVEAAWAAAPQQEAWVAWLVPAFALANTIAFAYTMYVNDCPSSHRLLLGPPYSYYYSSPSSSSSSSTCVFPSLLGRFAFEPFSVNPLLGPSLRTLDKLGALNYAEVVEGGQGWRLIACIWLHAGVVHLLANMLSLLFIGVRLEQEFGFVKIGMLYLLSGFGGSLMSCLSIRTKISVGASGALFGLLGAMLSELIMNWTIYANKFAALLTLIVVIAINLAVGIVPHVDSSAHIGGFISGFLLGFVLLIRPQFGWINRKHIPPGYNIELVKPKHKTYQHILWLVAIILLITGFLIGLIKLFRGVSKQH